MIFPKGQIIAFEGLDCCFKETNYKKFVEYLRQNFHNKSKNRLLTAAFPRYKSGSAYMVEQYLGNKIDSRRLREGFNNAVCSFYSIDRLHYWNTLFNIENGIQISNLDISQLPGTCFVFDRYSFSNAIYNPDNGQIITKHDIMKEKEIFGNPLPTILVWFRMGDLDKYLEILGDKPNKDFNESDREFIKSVWVRCEAFFKTNILEECGITAVIIDCLDSESNIRSKEEIFQSVLTGIQSAIIARTAIAISDPTIIED